uniref:uncharacterized protein LOC122581866 isoform X2 n=1 Tax=Erigeron canadensis TaxID=72917 RepID=UPI001CB99D26|nr:uncharacterized protein LOC122581866 isoform X2 [Erigeron canadensis]
MMMMMEQNKHEEEVCSDDNNKVPPLFSKYPWFGVQNLEDLTHQSFSTLHNPLFNSQCRIPELLGKRIRGCFHGWVILSNHPHNNTWSLWNSSSTSNIISLPPLLLKDGDYDSIRDACLSAPPDDPNSVILLTRTNKPTFVFCQLSPKKIKSRRNKPRWTEMSYAYQLSRVSSDGHLLHSLACCNGHVYALCDDSTFVPFLVRVEIAVKDREIVVRILLLAAVPFPSSFRCPKHLHFLTGYRTELFYIVVGFRSFLRETIKTPGDVFLFKADMTSIKWKVLESVRTWEDFVSAPKQIWEEVKDLKEGIFVVDLANDTSEIYNPAIGSELGGYIHIHDKMDKLIYSYHLNSKTFVQSPMPFPVLPTSHMSMLEDDDREAKFTVDSKQQEDEMTISFITDNEVEVSESPLLDVPFDVLEMLMKVCVGVEYMNFRATCKCCHQAVPLIQWRDQTALQNYSLASPWLMVVDQTRGVITFTDPLCWVTTTLLEFQNFRLLRKQYTVPGLVGCCLKLVIIVQCFLTPSQRISVNFHERITWTTSSGSQLHLLPLIVWLLDLFVERLRFIMYPENQFGKPMR